MDASRAFDGLFGADDTSFLDGSWRNWGDIIEPDPKANADSPPRLSKGDSVPKQIPQTPCAGDPQPARFLCAVATPAERRIFKLSLATPSIKATPKPLQTPVGNNDEKKEMKPLAAPSGERMNKDEESEGLKRRIAVQPKSEKRVKIDFLQKTPARPPEGKSFSLSRQSEKPTARDGPRAEVPKSEVKAVSSEAITPRAEILEAVTFVQSLLSTLESQKSQRKPPCAKPPTQPYTITQEMAARLRIDYLSLQLEAETILSDLLALEKSLDIQDMLSEALAALPVNSM